jgi:hypothetical protein
MCETCRRIEESGVGIPDLLSEELTFASLNKHNEPIFRDRNGNEWELVRDQLYESLWWLKREE